MIHKNFFIFIIPFILTACANSIHRPLNINEGNGALIDIKQRAIFVSKQTDDNSTTFVCAEPSPDAMSAFAAETSLSVQEKVNLAAALQEGATYTGLRTQSIQLLRDGMYRLCEARMSGALDNDEYNLLLRRYQKNMVALLAIEQLTGTVKAPVTMISTSGSASLALDVETRLSQIEKLQKEQKQLEEDLATEKAKGAEDSNKKIEGLTTDIENRDALIEGLKQGMANNSSIIVNGASVASSGQQSSAEDKDKDKDKTIQQQISATIESIVKEIIKADDLPAMCFSYLKRRGPTEYGDKLSTTCNQLLTSIAQSRIDNQNLRKLIIEDYLKKGKYEESSDFFKATMPDYTMQQSSQKKDFPLLEN